MTAPKNAAEWLEQDTPYPHRTLLELRLIAMLRDAKAELEVADAIIGAFRRAANKRALGPLPVNYEGWAAIEAKWKRGGYR